MATKTQILTVLANEADFLSRNKLAEKLGENTYRNFQTQLDRFERQGLLEGNEEHEYKITDVGRKELSIESEVTEETSEEQLGTTEYQRFMELGRITGVSPPHYIKQIADHVWNGGDYDDLDWVALAMQQMWLRQDLRNRWWHSWRSSLKKPIPDKMPTPITEGEAKGDAKTAGKGKGTRGYILDAEDKPVYVGEGYGDLDYEDALELSKIRGGRGSKATAAPQSPGSMADDMVKLFGAFKEFMGEKAQGKSWIVQPGEEGLQVEEVDPNRPMILNYPPGDNKGKATFFVNSDGEVQEVQPGQPVIIKQPANLPLSNVSPQYLIDRSSGEITEVKPGQPIVIHTAQPQQQYPYAPIQIKDKEGNPMVLDLSTFIRLEEHRDKQRRDDESHETKMGIAKSFKDLISKATSALGNMGRD